MHYDVLVSNMCFLQYTDLIASMLVSHVPDHSNRLLTIPIMSFKILDSENMSEKMERGEVSAKIPKGRRIDMSSVEEWRFAEILNVDFRGKMMVQHRCDH
uniref:Uncharacterized protein n=1 Tax=Trichuris muris TaxID=70415 RepID=A0A5S6QGA8_TRIMR